MDWQNRISRNVELAPYTSLGCGGPAEYLLEVNGAEVAGALAAGLPEPYWVIGFGTNVLIADSGLPGTTLLLRGGSFEIDERGVLTADAGVWWDDTVAAAVERGWWGVELMSGIPGNAGAAVAGNIAAYGQAVADRLEWVEAIDPGSNNQMQRLHASGLDLAYRDSAFQTGRLSGLVITRAGFQLQPEPTAGLQYQSALDAATELGLSPDTLRDRRKIILYARDKAGSLHDNIDAAAHKSAGSFFKNPLVSPEQADFIARFDETGRTREQLAAQNRLHGGDDTRVSAALVMLAAGFRRGQEFGPVRLHPRHVLKIENHGDARAQDVYNLALHIIETVRERLDIGLEPEVRFLGGFEQDVQ